MRAYLTSVVKTLCALGVLAVNSVFPRMPSAADPLLLRHVLDCDINGVPVMSNGLNVLWKTQTEPNLKVGGIAV